MCTRAYFCDWWYSTMYSENIIEFPPCFYCSFIHFRFSIMRNVVRWTSVHLNLVMTRPTDTVLPLNIPILDKLADLPEVLRNALKDFHCFSRRNMLATAGWATCPPQSRQYRPSLSITSGERQYVRRKATNSTNSVWKERRPGGRQFMERDTHEIGHSIFIRSSEIA